MTSQEMPISSLMRMAANTAQVCMEDPKCVIDFESIGVEPRQDGYYAVNLPGAVLVKVFGQGRDKRFGTQGEPPWQASLHQIGRGHIGRGLELALETVDDVAPPDVITQMEEQFQKIGDGNTSAQRKIDWVKDCADTLEQLTDWQGAERLIEFKDYTSRMRARLSVLSRPFLKFQEEISELIDKHTGLRTESDWGTVDFFEVRDVANRVRQLSDQLSDITSDDISEDEIQTTTVALERVVDVLRRIRKWDLTDKDAAEERAEYIHLLTEREKKLRHTVYEWLPLWTGAQAEKRKAEAEQTEQRARQAQAEASGEAINVVAAAYEAQANQDKSSRTKWTIMAFVLVAGIVGVNIGVMEINDTNSEDGWSPERLDSLITRLLCTSVLGGFAYWAGRIATIKLRHETDNRLKAVIARTVEGMKEGAESDSAKEQIGLMSVARLVGLEQQKQGDETGPASGDLGPHVREGMEATIKKE